MIEGGNTVDNTNGTPQGANPDTNQPSGPVTAPTETVNVQDTNPAAVQTDTSNSVPNQITPNKIPGPQTQSKGLPPNAPPDVVRAYTGAHKLNGIMDVLGLAKPEYKTVINPDGSSSQVQLPRRNKDIGMALAVAAMTGAFSGLGERGPGATGRAAAMGFQQGAQMRQKSQDTLDQQSQTDFQRKQQTLEFNMRMMNLARETGRLDYEDTVNNTKGFAPLVDFARNHPEALYNSDVDAPVSSKEAADIQKHSPFQLLRVPIGDPVARLDANGNQVWLDMRNNVVPEGTQGAHKAWDSNYILLKNDALQSLRDENGDGVAPWLKDVVDKGAGINGSSQAMVAGGGASGKLSVATTGNMHGRQTMLDNFQSRVNKYVDMLNEGKNSSDKDFIQPMDVKKALLSKEQGSRLFLKDLDNFMKASTGRVPANEDPINAAIDSVKSKDPYSAGRLANFFNSDNLGEYRQRFNAKADAAKKAADYTADLKAGKMTDTDATAIIAKAKANPGSVDPVLLAQAHGVENGTINKEVSKARQIEDARLDEEAKYQREQNEFLTIPNGWTQQNSEEVSKLPDQYAARKYLIDHGVKVPSNFAQAWNIGHDHAQEIQQGFPNRVSKGTGQMDVQNAGSYITSFVNPHFQNSDYAAAKTFNNELGSTKAGTAGGTLFAAGRAAQHLNSWMPVFAALNNGQYPLANSLANAIGKQTGHPEVTNADTFAHFLAAEVEKTVSAGTPLQERMKDIKQELNSSSSNEQFRGVAHSIVDLMHGSVSEVNQKSNQYYNRPVKGISPNTSKLYLQMGFDTPWLDKPQGATGTAPSKADGQLHWISSQGQDLGAVNYQYWK